MSTIGPRVRTLWKEILKPGTPIATFLDRQGRITDKYAGGGAGTPGAHLDHAAVFQGYTRDKNGNITGMDVSEQYADSHGIHTRHYDNNSKLFGENNAGNYFAIKTNQGYLGGAANPMTRSQVKDPTDIGLEGALKMAQANYDKLKSIGPNSTLQNRDIGIQAHANDLKSRQNAKNFADQEATMSSMLVKRSTEDALSAHLEARKSSSPVVQQFNQHTNSASDGHEKSGRISSKDVGSPTAPPSRLKELFSSPETGKGY
jgi:hypothetical protein